VSTVELTDRETGCKQASTAASDAAGQVQDFAYNLLIVHDRAGRWLSFYWDQAELVDLSPSKTVQQGFDGPFRPTQPDVYHHALACAFEQRQPQQLAASFEVKGQQFTFDLTLHCTEVTLPEGLTTLVMVMGRHAGAVAAREVPQDLPLHRSQPVSNPSQVMPWPQRVAIAQQPIFHDPRLASITWGIHNTLDLDIIWQQIVDDVGTVLATDQCLIGPYQAGEPHVTIAAAYQNQGSPSGIGLKLSLADHVELHQALTTLSPVLLTQISPKIPCATLVNPGTGISTLVAATYYKSRPNALLILHRGTRHWTETEIELIAQLSEPIGTAIAHAQLFAESQALAAELQRVNTSLVEQRRVIEEAQRQAEEASRLKSEFLANTSHELRTPLNGMIGFLKLVMDGMADDPAEQQEFLQEAYKSALHLLNLINDILDIAKIEAGKMQLEVAPVGLDELLNHVESFTRAQAQQKSLYFNIEKLPTRDEVILYGNYQRLLQVMLNLVGNAIKFTHEGGITISSEITLQRVTYNNQELPGTVMIKVADTGIGVSLEKQDKLFQSFSQVDGSRTRQYGGTGLGLAISQKLVEAMGGIVNFYSMGEGLGSTVTFTVPLYQEPVFIATE